MIKKILVVLIGTIGLQGCAQIAPPPASDWVDVPLAENTYWAGSVPFKQADYQIPLAAGAALEHMLTINEGDLVVYEWSAPISDPTLLTAEFHGHTIREGEAPGTVMFYKMHKASSEAGTLKAPFNGIHGWYFKNEGEEDMVIALKVSGFFTD